MSDDPIILTTAELEARDRGYALGRRVAEGGGDVIFDAACEIGCSDEELAFLGGYTAAVAGLSEPWEYEEP